MARIRALKPDFFKDEDLATLPYEARLWFQGLWCLADRLGRLEYRPKYLKVEIFPYDDVDPIRLCQMLMAPNIPGKPEKRFIDIYEANGRQYINIIHFLDHQTPHHTEKNSKIPTPNGELTVKEPLRSGKEGKGIMGKINGEEEGARCAPPAIPQRRAIALEKAKAAWPDVQAALEKHVLHGERLCIPDNTSRMALNKFGLELARSKIATNCDEVEAGFVELYAVAEMAEFTARRGGG